MSDLTLKAKSSTPFAPNKKYFQQTTHSDYNKKKID
jgi:hypothetical protein